MARINGKNVMLCYLDEAGNTHFDQTGSRYFLYTALVLTGDGFPLHRALLECRYDVIGTQGRFSNSHELNDHFHATEDSLETRSKVFPVLRRHADDARVLCLVTEKKSLPAEEQTQPGLFVHAASNLVRAGWEEEGPRGCYDHVCVMLDSIPVQKRRRAIIGAIKRALASVLEGGATFSVMPVASKSDLCLQAVDYYSWALYRKWESGDDSQLRRLGDNITVIEPGKNA